MKKKTKKDLRETLIDAHAHFFFLKGDRASRVRLWQVLPDGFVIDAPSGAPMHRTVLGYVPTLDGAGVYEIDGSINPDTLPDQMPGTIRVDVDPAHVRKVNRRLFPRVSFTPPIAASATAEGEARSFPVRIVNFSAGGLRVESERELSPEKTHLFSFRSETDEEVHDLRLKGQIVYELPLDGGHAYGVKFLEAARGRGGEAAVESLDQTVDLLGLVNKLLVRE